MSRSWSFSPDLEGMDLLKCKSIVFILQDEDCRGLGTTDGFIEGFQCFKCEENCGMFVAMDKLAKPQCDFLLVRQQSDDNAPIKKGDRVATCDDHGTPVQGAVQWIGKNRIIMPDETLIVGIYTVSVVYVECTYFVLWNILYTCASIFAS